MVNSLQSPIATMPLASQVGGVSGYVPAPEELIAAQQGLARTAHVHANSAARQYDAFERNEAMGKTLAVAGGAVAGVGALKVFDKTAGTWITNRDYISKSREAARFVQDQGLSTTGGRTLNPLTWLNSKATANFDLNDAKEAAQKTFGENTELTKEVTAKLAEFDVEKTIEGADGVKSLVESSMKAASEKGGDYTKDMAKGFEGAAQNSLTKGTEGSQKFASAIGSKWNALPDKAKFVGKAAVVVGAAVGAKMLYDNMNQGKEAQRQQLAASRDNLVMNAGNAAVAANNMQSGGWRDRVGHRASIQNGAVNYVNDERAAAAALAGQQQLT